MKVKTLVAHDNGYDVQPDGEGYHKRVGSVYNIVPDEDAQVLIRQKFVEVHSSERSGK